MLIIVTNVMNQSLNHYLCLYIRMFVVSALGSIGRLQELWPAGIHAELGGGNASFGIITCVLFFQFFLFLSFHLCGYCSLFVCFLSVVPR